MAGLCCDKHSGASDGLQLATIHSCVHALRLFAICSWRNKMKDLWLLARARNEYLQALQEQQYADTDLLIAVDTDMCAPWDVDRMEQVLNRLMFPAVLSVGQASPSSRLTSGSSGNKAAAEQPVDVVYAYGACGWFSRPTRGAAEVAPDTPGAFARYCDLFALQDIHGHRYVKSQGGAVAGLQLVDSAWRLPVPNSPLSNSTFAADGGDRLSPLLSGSSGPLPALQQLNTSTPKSLCDSAAMQGAPGCVMVNGEPVLPVQAAFGGLGVFRANLFKNQTVSRTGRGVPNQLPASSANGSLEPERLARGFTTPSRTMLDMPGLQNAAAGAGDAGEGQGPCRYATDETGTECEHIPLGNCLYVSGHTQVIALQLVIGWDANACDGPVRDSMQGSKARSDCKAACTRL
jgi:hypothetical protein